MAERAVSFLIPKLGSLIADEARSVLGLRKRITSIRDELQWIHSFLRDSDHKRDKFQRVDIWVSQIGDLAYEAQDVIEVFFCRLEQQRQRSNMKRLIHYPEQFFIFHKLQKKIKLMDRKFEKISTYRTRYNINETIKADESSSSGGLVLKENKPPTVEDMEVVGFEMEASELSKWMIEKKPKQLLVVSIIATEGRGKTTLAKKVYNNIKKNFDYYSWIYVSQECRIRDLLLATINQILASTDEDDDVKSKLENMNKSELKTELRRKLKGKRFLIVLDDVWTTMDWDTLKEYLLIEDNNTKSTVLITSCNKDVAGHAKQSIMNEDDKSCCKTHPLRPLNFKESWELFLKVVFPTSAKTSSSIVLENVDNRNLNWMDRIKMVLPGMTTELDNLESNLTKEMKDLGKKMAVKCEGLPLAIVMLGGLLFKKEKTNAEWSNVLENNMSWSPKQENQCLDVLTTLSYADLPFDLKYCFLYFGLFPQDYEIDADKLIRLWVAEGFVQQIGEDTVEDAAQNCIEELSQRNMIQVVRGDDGRVKKCGIHKKLRDVAIIIGEREKFLSIHGKNNFVSPTNSSRRISLQSDNSKYHYTTVGLHSLLLFSEMFDFKTVISQQKRLLKLSTFSENPNRLLRVLDLENAKNVDILPQEIGREFILLKYLSLRGTNVRKLPHSVKNLCLLTTLDLYNTNIKEIRSEIWKMKQLRHLLFSRHWRLPDEPVQRPPKRIDGLRDIQTLWLKAGRWIEDCLDKLIDLKVLKIDGNPQKYVKPIADAIVKLVRLRELYIVSDQLWKMKGKDLSGKDCQPLPHISLSSHDQIYKLVLAIRLQELPQQRDFPPNLTDLELSFGHLSPIDDPMESLEKLPNLRVLNIRGFTARKLTCSAGGFSELRSFEMRDFNNLKEWMVEEGTFLNLRVLKIGQCHDLKRLPRRFGDIPTLKELIFFHMPSQFTDWVNTRTGEEWEKFGHIPTIMDRDPM